MKNIATLLILVFAMTLCITTISAQIPEDITSSLQVGNASKLAGSFNQNVELVVLDDENVYSKAHAEQIIGNFFKNNKPTKFSIVHQGGKGDSNYAIGTLHTESQDYRVYILLKTSNNAKLIHQLRIEKQGN